MYEHWLEHLFIPSTAHLNRPLLLIIDGHASHMNMKIINLLKANQIICLILPSHTTHALQPLDVVVFSSVKSEWSKIVRNHFKEGRKSIKNGDFPRLLKKLLIDKRAFTPMRIVSSFARAGKLDFYCSEISENVTTFVGVWPFDADAMRDKVAPNVNTLTMTASTSNLPIPTNILLPQSQSGTTTTPSSASSSVLPGNDSNDTVANVDASQPSSSISAFDQTGCSQSSIANTDDGLTCLAISSSYAVSQSSPLDLTTYAQAKQEKKSRNAKSSRKSLSSKNADGNYLLDIFKNP